MLPLIAIGTNEQAFTWEQAFPSADYKIDASIAVTIALAADVSWSVKPGSQTATGCIIVVQVGVLLAAGAILTVIAYEE